MGYDAFVHCNCLKKEKTKPGPIPMEDIYVDEDGGFWAHVLDESNDHNLMHAFWAWCENYACEHKDMMACDEHVANISGMARLRYLCDKIGKDKIPHLIDFLPEGNWGQFFSSKAQDALNEIPIFRDYMQKHGIEEWLICEKRNFSTVVEVPKYEVYQHDGDNILAIEQGYLVGYKDGDVQWCSKWFKKQDNLLIDREGGTTFVLDAQTRFAGVDGFPNMRNVVHVVSEWNEANWANWKADIFESLLKASIETGNPIVWI